MKFRDVGRRWNREQTLPWLGAFGVHAVIAVLLQVGGGPNVVIPETHAGVEAIRVHAMDERELTRKREAHRQAEAERVAKQEEKETSRRAAIETRAKQEAAEAKARLEAAERARQKAAALKEAEARAQARKAEEDRRQTEVAARMARQANAWRVAIEGKVKRAWLRPPASHRVPCEVEVEQNRRGEVLSVKVLDCPASKAWRESLRNAVRKASPLPLPPRPELFDRTLILTFKSPAG